MENFFIDVKDLPNDGYGLFQLCFLGATYGYILTNSSSMISEGSELLLLVPSLAGIVGSIVLPVLGSVPDGAIVLFSGMGPDAQEQLTVGVGALVGSTVLLLTVPWFLAVYSGRVPIQENLQGNLLPDYKSKKKIHTYEGTRLLNETGVPLNPTVNKGSTLMIFTSLTYLMLQIPGLYVRNLPIPEQAAGEYPWAFLGCIVCTVLFVGYLYYMYQLSLNPSATSTQTLVTEEIIRKAITDGKVTLLGVMGGLLRFKNIDTAPPNEKSALLQSSKSFYENGRNQIAYFEESSMEMLGRILKPFFNRYDSDGSGQLDMEELYVVFMDLGVSIPYKNFHSIFTDFDEDKSGEIDYNEFVQGTANYLCQNHQFFSEGLKKQGTTHLELAKDMAGEKTENDDDEEEGEEMPDDIKDLTPEQQQQQILKRAFTMMGLGSLIVLIISDPMVAVLSEMGERTGVPAFYVSFILAPLISNSAELIATFTYASKKTEASISISLATLQGAVTMNNTFVLAIFMLLIVMQGLSWEFFAETLTVLLVQLVVGYVGLQKMQTVKEAAILLSLYPLSLVLVAVLEAHGWD